MPRTETRGPSSLLAVERAIGQAVGAEPLLVETRAHAPGTFRVGARVFHQKFGYGLVRAVDGNKLEIAFDHAGLKKVIDSFVQPA